MATLGLLASVASLPFLSDDFAFIFPDTLSSATWIQRGGDGFYRPLGNTILALAAHTLPPSPLPWGLWILASNLVVSALAGILGAHLSQQNENPNWFVGVWTSALFLAHAAHPEASVWLAGRFDVLATLFVFGGILSALAWIRSERWPWLAASIVCMMAAITTKEIAYTYPALLLLVFLLRPVEKRRVALAFAWHAAAAFLLLAFRFWLFHGFGGYVDPETGISELHSVGPLHLVKAYGTRLLPTLLFPVNLSVNPNVFVTLMIAVGAVCYGRIAFRANLARSVLVFSLGWMVFASLPAISQLLIGPDLEKSRVLFLASFGICFLLANAISLRRKSTGARAWELLFALFWVSLLYHNLHIRRDVAFTVDKACQQAAEIARSTPKPIRLEGLPPLVHGIYAFSNGFPTCVGKVSGRHPDDIDNARDNVPNHFDESPATWRWNAQEERFQQLAEEPEIQDRR